MFKESIHLELKKEYVKDILKTVIAFANTSGGKIYIGIDDDGKVLGVQKLDTDILKLSNSIRDSIKPDITLFTSILVEKIDGKDVIVVDVQKGASSPYYLTDKGILPSGVYVRQGASSVPATDAAILKMIRDTDGDNFEELRSLNQNLDFVFLKKEFVLLRRTVYSYNQEKRDVLFCRKENRPYKRIHKENPENTPR